MPRVRHQTRAALARPAPTDHVLISEVFINQDEGHRYGESEPYDTGRTFAEIGRLFDDLRREHGRCVSKVYIERGALPPQAVGWVFEKRVFYEDDAQQTYLRQVWVHLHRRPNVQTTTQFLAQLA